MENQIIQINLVPNLSTPAVVRVSQYDVGRPLVFKVYDGTSPADLTGVTAVIEGTKKSGLGFSESGTVSDNTVTLNTTLAMTQEDGSIPAEIRFSKTGEDVGTANFILSVEKTPHADGTTDGTQETMQNLEGRLQTQIDDLDTRVDVLEAGSEEGSGLTQEEKNLILTLFNKAAYAEDDAKTSYDALEALWRTVYRSITYNLTNCRSSSSVTSVENGKGYSTALSVMGGYSITTASVIMGGTDVTASVYHNGSITIPRVTGDVVITVVATKAVNSITATYTQSGTVYDTDSLDSLKSDLVVTANYSDSTTETVTDYTLSGTLADGTSTVTVSYGGKTASFNVTVTHWQPITANITWSGSGGDKTSSVIDATEYDVYLTVPFDSTSSDILEGATAASAGLKGYATLYTDSTKQNRYAYYYFDTEEVKTSGYRTNVNCPVISFDTKIKIAPKGYYVTITAFKSGSEVFNANSNVLNYLRSYANTVTLE